MIYTLFRISTIVMIIAMVCDAARMMSGIQVLTTDVFRIILGSYLLFYLIYSLWLGKFGWPTDLLIDPNLKKHKHLSCSQKQRFLLLSTIVAVIGCLMLLLPISNTNIFIDRLIYSDLSLGFLVIPQRVAICIKILMLSMGAYVILKFIYPFIHSINTQHRS